MYMRDPTVIASWSLVIMAVQTESVPATEKNDNKDHDRSMEIEDKPDSDDNQKLAGECMII